MRAGGLALLFSLLLSACAGPSGPESPPSFELSARKAFLYEISKPGSGEPSIYLLGSMHVLDQPLRLGPDVLERYERCDALVLELDPTRITPEEAGDLMLRHGLLAPGESLSSLLGPETLSLLQERLSADDFSPQERTVVEHVRPWAISLILVEKQLTALQIGSENGVDQHFAAELAPDRALPILELETADEQFYAMSSLSPEIAEEMLLQTLEGRGAYDAGAMLEAWKSGDEERLAAIVFADADRIPAFYEAIFTERNARMADGLAELLEQAPDRTYFAVIGAGHVVGTDSVPALLRELGYRVERAR